MVHGTARARYCASTLVRELDRLSAAETPESKRGFAEDLSRWLDWTHAISLSAALGTPALSETAVACADPAQARAQAAAEFERVQAGLLALIARLGEPAPAVGRGRPSAGWPPHAAPAADPPTDFASYRQHYQTVQQAMQTRIDTLRQRLRATLAAWSGDGARLAALDAAMAQALGEREQVLLAGLPRRLEPHFERLRRAATTPGATAEPAPAWPTTFLQDMRAVLRAELHTRLLPAAGLLDALTALPARHHA